MEASERHALKNRIIELRAKQQRAKARVEDAQRKAVYAQGLWDAAMDDLFALSAAERIEIMEAAK